MKNFEKYLTLNFLSIMGLTFLVLFLIVIFFLYPNAAEYDRISGEDAPYGLYNLFYFGAIFLFFNTLVELAIIPCIFIEFSIYKIKNTSPKLIKISNQFKKFHFTVFVLGLILSIIALILGLIYIYNPFNI